MSSPLHQFKAEYETLFDGAEAGPADRWRACNFFDKVILAQSSVVPQYWPGGGPTRPVPGLPDQNGYEGAEELAGHLVFWRGDSFIWSDLNDFSTYIAVGETASSLSVQTVEAFTQPGSGETSDWVHIDEDLTNFTVGQFTRIDLDGNDPTAATYNFYTVEAVSNPSGYTADSCLFSQTIPADGESYKVFTTAGVIVDSSYVEWQNGGKLKLGGYASNLQITGSSRALSPLFTSAAISEAVPSPGGTFHITLAENPSSLKVGDVLSLGNIAGAGLDLYEVTQVAFFLELRRLDVGTQKQALGYKFPTGTYLTFQPWVQVKNLGASAKVVPSGTALTVQGAVKLKPVGATGEVPAGTVIPIDSTIQSLDANEAGSAINAGGQINGDIWQIYSLGEYGVIYKERSIQTIQYVGRLNGVFFTRPEVLDEGLLARNAICRISDSKIAFLGHKHFYIHSGGANLEPFALQHEIEVFNELDRSRADEIVAYHNEADTQIWFVYPTLSGGPTKVLIFNYLEGSVVIDLYDEALGGITALGGVDWEVAPAWEDLLESQIWSTETKRWYEYSESGLKRYTIIATGGDAGVATLGEDPDTTVPRLLLHGRVFSRSSGDNCTPAAYYSVAETQDYDFGDARLFKYVDTVTITLAVDSHLTRPMKLWVQIGSKANFDDDINWSTPAAIEASGNGNYLTRVNLRSAGRYHRVRFFSNQVDCQWRIAGFALFARPGGTY